MRHPQLSSLENVIPALTAADYLPSAEIGTTVFLAAQLGRPILIEGPAGVGKTALAKAVAAATGSDLIRLQCYEGVDEARALYEWNHAKQLLRITAEQGASWDSLSHNIFGEEFLLERPLLAAIRADRPTVLLIDELDKADEEMEGLLLEVLSDFQVTIPELGTISATNRPFVVITSNAARDLSDALRRRCLFLHIDYPSTELERRIVLHHVPELPATVADSHVRVVDSLRRADLRKPPSVSESVDWARTLVTLAAGELTDRVMADTLGVLLKHQEDIEAARTLLKLTP